MFSDVLIGWFRQNGRQLPWRGTSDPYAIWLSEVILQQTRVSQGMAYWQRFMERYPTVASLAAATEDDVLLLWQGLGYYSRARNLHKAARQIVGLGRFPDTFEGLKRLKGVGEYTAAAIGSMAFGLPVAVVDGNVYRVLSRYFGISTPINSTEGVKEFRALAQSLLPPDAPSAYNQAIMDFGAMQCVPQSPACMDCPLMDGCAALREGRVGELPVKERKLKVQTRRLTYVYIRCNGQTAFRRRPEGDIWQGLWEPYNAGEAANGLGEMLDGMVGEASVGSCKLTLVAKDVRHVLTHRILMADFYLLETQGRPLLPSEYEWLDEGDICNYAIPRLVELLIGRISD